MDQWGGDWEVPEHEDLIPALSLPDADDRHVLAAAIAGRVPVIVTFNLSDFPEMVLAPYGIRALHPDAFLMELLDAVPDAFLAALRHHRIVAQESVPYARGIPGALYRQWPSQNYSVVGRIQGSDLTDH